MKERDEWDDHTQAIVTSRLSSNDRYEFLTLVEAEMLRSICSLLVDDEKQEVLRFILRHIDETLRQPIGESERKAGVPPAPELIRSGLKAIERGVLLRHSTTFMSLDKPEQAAYLRKISENAAEPSEAWAGIPQEPLFRKLCTLTIEAYCSHPRIWSEIGYAGPAYPRGYVRTQLGQLDPWEAQPE
jgi:hypothetical protein